ncbi:polysaccharide lyase family 8 protein [Phycomyces blakesleeanus]|uniref:Polysaccharide lyase family 8 protein n=2 Tax=Phycomyces blakesleeanus TaxID=4837 RepID=A0A162TE87_PHYB8|nr:polysaccharide lyase family 8 protein [Phycomyces blakesleeanus NRRL 1555(-)]OAD67902.1 polysaccharide lyase family 8 protein [Phycomyces blakesleeanus NRRL 1555(-)]|eukprot:XP_018285942.1 polysaccharide lyase family 8 protein [Phycomyces blakesleeanus NRRL 1555(-)]
MRILFFAGLLTSLVRLVYSQTSSAQDMSIFLDRKNQNTVQTALASTVPNTWINNLTSQGTWPDIDYSTGCDGRRANWPAQYHFQRIVTMASLWYVNQSDNTLLEKSSLAMDYWFSNNYVPDSCIDMGGLSNNTCPCGTPGFWSTNWFGQMILMPRIISNACLLLKPNLTGTQLGNCTSVTKRSFDKVDDFIFSIGYMTGSNMLDVSSIGMAEALLTNNLTLMTRALDYFYKQLSITPSNQDGIKQDGSFLQHFGQLYTGNYGKDFINSVLRIFLQTADTAFAPSLDTQSAFEILLEGTEWMIVGHPNQTLWWDYSTIGRMVSFPVSSQQASGGVAINISQITEATTGWPHQPALVDIVDRLRTNTTNSPNRGPLLGTRHFYSSDYLVHRTRQAIVTLKMYSKRTTNGECNNSQNPYGFHLSDGAIYTYRTGEEYVDVFASWDWNLVPGTTVDVGKTPLECNLTQWTGVESFVGGATHGDIGIAVMNYTNPMTHKLSWQKTFVFFPQGYAVQLNNVRPDPQNVTTTLDQRRLNGPVYINRQAVADGSTVSVSVKANEHMSVWHDRIGYTLIADELQINTAPKQGNWSTLGISNDTQTMALFTPTTTNLQAYLVQIDVEPDYVPLIPGFVLVQNNTGTAEVRGAYTPDFWVLAFWSSGSYISKTVSITVDRPIVLILQPTISVSTRQWDLSVADPSQTIASVHIDVQWPQQPVQPFDVTLPSGNEAGNSVLVSF